MKIKPLEPYLNSARSGIVNPPEMGPTETGIAGSTADTVQCSFLPEASPNNQEEQKTAALPSNLSLPKKRLGIPLPNLKLLMGAATLRLLTTFGGGLSAAAANDEAEERLSQSQIEDIKKTLKPGDIILSRTPSNQMYYILQKATFGSAWSHAAMYAGNNKIVDSYERVKSQEVEDFCAKQTAIIILRPSHSSDGESEKALLYLKNQIGKPYDWRFDIADDNAHYCTEIILRALEAANPRLTIPGRWLLGKPVIVPDDFLKARGLRVIKEFE